ncbi:MAG: hypothetical protein ACTSXJ_07020 [Candidatus Baldrarchaeia archaeon]
MSEEIIPLHAQTFFVVTRSGEIIQFLEYDYYDPNEYYKELTHKEEEFIREIEKLWANMQQFMDECKIYINGEEVRAEVVFTDIQHRGASTVPYVIWIIVARGKFRSGVNEYRVICEEEKLEYDCEAFWVFPHGTRILSVKTYMNYDVYDNLIILWARKGDIIGGEEIIKFELP